MLRDNAETGRQENLRAKEQTKPKKKVVELRKQPSIYPAVITDVTGHEQTERALQAGEERFRTLFEQAVDSIVVIDAKTGKMAEFNNKACEMLGCSREEFANLKLKDIEAVESEEEIAAHIDKAARQNGDVFETRHRKKDGTLCDVLVSAKLITIDNKQYIQGIWHDITYLKKTEEQLRKSRARMGLILDSIPDAIFHLDRELKIMWANKTATKKAGVCVGLKCYQVFHKREDVCPDCSSCIKAMEQGRTCTSLLRLETTPDGQPGPMFVEHTAIPWKEPGGEVTGVIVVARNVTESRMVEQTRERLLEVLEEKNWELESIIHVTSHDLQTPLITISGFSEELAASCRQISSLISEKGLSEKTRAEFLNIIEKDIPESVELIKAGTLKMNLMMDGLVRLAKLGYSATEITTIDMNHEMEQLKKAIAFQLKEADAALIIEPLPVCLGDRAQITQIFTNLLGNAVKYLDPSRRGVIRVSGTTDQFYSTYCVEDNGIGIAPQNLTNIFKMYYRVNSNHSEGEGIGLSIVKRIINRHHGRVWVESNFGSGSRFYVALAKTADKEH